MMTEEEDSMVLEKYLKNKAIIAIASIIIGVFMIIKGGTLADDMVRVIGYIMIGTGVVYALAYFFGPNKDQMLLGYAIVSAVAGLVIVLLAKTIVSAFPILAGAVLILNGLINLTQVDGAPAYSKGTALLLIALGVLVIVFKYTVVNVVVILMGISLVLNGILSLDTVRRADS